MRSALVDLVLGDDARVAETLRALAARGQWPQLVALAVEWRVVPHALERCGRIGDLDEALKARVRAVALQSALHSALLLRTCASVQGMLAAAGVVSVAVKGIATIATLYGSASRRMLADIDLVIEENGVPAALGALERAGFADISPPFERHVAAIGYSRYLHNYARTFVRDGIEIDLHWRFGPRPPASLAARRVVERSIECRVDRVAVRTAAPLETALIAVHHALRNSFPAAGTLKDTLDLALWWRRFGASQGEALVAAALESGMATSLLALSSVIAQRDDEPSVARGVAMLQAMLPRAEVREAERLRSFIEQNLSGEAPENITVELLAPAVFVRSLVAPLLEIKRSGWRGGSEGFERPGPRRPLLARIAARVGRGRKTLRELMRLRRVASYRAVARAQSRFH